MIDNLPNTPTDQDVVSVVAIDVDGRQKYIFETDKLQEMLGASRIIDQTKDQAEMFFNEEKGLYLFLPVSGEIRAWAHKEKQRELLDAAWDLRLWLEQRGVSHTCVYFETCSDHFEKDNLEKQPGVEQPEPEIDPGYPCLDWVHKSLLARMRRRKDLRRGEDNRPRCSLFSACQLHAIEPANLWMPDGFGAEEDEERRKLVSARARAKWEAWKNAKHGYGQNEREEGFYQQYLKRPVEEQLRYYLDKSLPELNRPIYFKDLTDDIIQTEDRDSYLAFVCADGDGMGKILSALNWNDLRWQALEKEGTKRKPWERNRNFALEYDDCVKEAFAEAVADVVVPDPKTAKDLYQQACEQEDFTIQLPLLPQLLGGDDLWMVSKRDIALELCQKFSAHYEKLVNNKYQSYGTKDEKLIGSTTLHQAIQVAGFTSVKDHQGTGVGGDARDANENQDQSKEPVALTISFGVAFAKAGFPAHAMIEAAEALLKSAKSLRKQKIWGRQEEGKLQGCLDWHWIESSCIESMADARRQGWSYADGQKLMLLTSRPWSILQTEQFLAAAKELGKVARRKREQLEAILRRGHQLSKLAAEEWWKGLLPREREVIEQVNENLKSAGWPVGIKEGNLSEPFDPWRRLGAYEIEEKEHDKAQVEVYATPLLDLLALQHVMGIEGKNPPAPSPAEPMGNTDKLTDDEEVADGAR